MKNKNSIQSIQGKSKEMLDEEQLRVVFVLDQTELVVNFIKDIEGVNVDYLDNGDESYIFWLVDVHYYDVIKDLKLPQIYYAGSLWFAQTWYGASLAIGLAEYEDELVKALPFLKEATPTPGPTLEDYAREINSPRAEPIELSDEANKKHQQSLSDAGQLLKEEHPRFPPHSNDNV